MRYSTLRLPAVCLVDELGDLLQVVSGVHNHGFCVIQVQRSQGERQEVQPVYGWSQQLERDVFLLFLNSGGQPEASEMDVDI
ncbi:hypothetical protein XENOCAPTIV_022495 [Xenoophorus captivus]|uniref:Uncharacterized protein n=1 Tax=Xenoophorus captivus TaxID=1517983 RepID=A0ABV0QW88_9TELE